MFRTTMQSTALDNFRRYFRLSTGTYFLLGCFFARRWAIIFLKENAALIQLSFKQLKVNFIAFAISFSRSSFTFLINSPRQQHCTALFDSYFSLFFNILSSAAIAFLLTSFFPTIFLKQKNNVQYRSCSTFQLSFVNTLVILKLRMPYSMNWSEVSSSSEASEVWRQQSLNEERDEVGEGSMFFNLKIIIHSFHSYSALLLLYRMGNSCQRQQRQPNHEHSQYNKKPEVKKKRNRAQIPPPPDLQLQEKNVLVDHAQPVSKQPSYFGINDHKKQLPMQRLSEEFEYYQQSIEVPASKKCRYLENYGNPCNHPNCASSKSYYPSPINSNARMRQHWSNYNLKPSSGFYVYDPPFQ